MPIKYKASSKGKKGNMLHTYIHTISTLELQGALDADYTCPKMKQKIRNELTRRTPPALGWQRTLFP